MMRIRMLVMMMILVGQPSGILTLHFRHTSADDDDEGQDVDVRVAHIKYFAPQIFFIQHGTANILYKFNVAPQIFGASNILHLKGCAS